MSRDKTSASASSPLPTEVIEPVLVSYRSVGIGLFGVVMRWAGMPLEKIALFINSPQVSGKNQLSQAVKLTFTEGALAPYRVVRPASLVAWFLQYSIMGLAYQFFDQALSKAFNVRPMYYGNELMEPPSKTTTANNNDNGVIPYGVRSGLKTFLAPVIASAMESYISNRAEVQRYFGPDRFVEVEAKLNRHAPIRSGGPAFGASMMRNIIMCNTSFVLTPLTYKLYFPQQQKNQTTLFWFSMGMNVFVGNVVAITQQALWGRTLDYAARHGNINYRTVIQLGLEREGLAAFFTPPKWFARVLMNAPTQGTLPWFYNEVLPIGEPAVLQAAHSIYNSVIGTSSNNQTFVDDTSAALQRDMPPAWAEQGRPEAVSPKQ